MIAKGRNQQQVKQSLINNKVIKEVQLVPVIRSTPASAQQLSMAARQAKQAQSDMLSILQNDNDDSDEEEDW